MMDARLSRCTGWIAAVLLLAGACAAQADDVEFSTPVNGWRNTAGDTSRYTQDVHYPAVAVTTPEGQSKFAMIAGQIRATPKRTNGGGSAAKNGKKTSVATMIVNGTVLPQRIEEDGSFSRPWAFAGGSNSVELRTADGTSKRIQFYDAYSNKTRPRLRIVLAWDTDGTDLDLHVVSPDGVHTFYGDRVAPNGGALDVDVTTGFGPEIYSTPAPLHGTYLVYVNYYGQGESGADMTVAQITIITDENTPNEKSETIVVPMRKAGELTLAKKFVIP
ncbi:YfaP family protein [Paraburkholderia acidicola]